MSSEGEAAPTSPVSSRTRGAHSSRAGASSTVPEKQRSSPALDTQVPVSRPERAAERFPWLDVKAKNEIVEDMLRTADEMGNDDIEMMMVESLMSYDLLKENGGPPSLLAWQRYCRLRGVPNFEYGRNIQDSFRAFSQTSLGNEDKNYVELGGAGESRGLRRGNASSSPNEVAFTKYFERYVFTGEPNGMPFAVWYRKFEQARTVFRIDDSTARSALPLILGGSAEALVSSAQHQRLDSMLAMLKSSFDSNDKREQRILALSRLNLDQFITSSPSRHESLVRLRAAVEAEARELDVPDNTPDGLARHVSRAIMASTFSPLFTLIQARNPEEKIFKFSHILKGMDYNKGTLFGKGDDILTGFQKAEGPRRRFATKTDKLCSFCGIKGHEESTCWKKHGRPPSRVAWVDPENEGEPDPDVDAEKESVASLREKLVDYDQNDPDEQA